MKTYSKLIESVFFSALLGMSLLISVPEAAIAGDDCSCRFRGQDVPTGKSICMKTSKGMVMAKCDWVLNNTAWKFTEQPCPYAEFNHTPIGDKFLRKQINSLG